MENMTANVTLNDTLNDTLNETNETLVSQTAKSINTPRKALINTNLMRTHSIFAKKHVFFQTFGFSDPNFYTKIQTFDTNF